MKSIRRVILLIAGMVSINACKNKTVNNSPAVPEITNIVNGIELDKRFASADSLVVVFYKDPFGSDSLRYTRYYNQHITIDSSFITELLYNLNQPFTKQEKIKPCRSEGKVWMYSQGKLFQTIYFAYSKADCYFTYLIRDGFFYYMDIKPVFIGRLDSLKKIAKEPM